MGVEQAEDFLGLVTSLCQLVVSPGGSPAITTAHLKRTKAIALKNILFPPRQDAGSCDGGMCELARLHNVWFTLARAGHLERAGRLRRLLDSLGGRPTPEVRSVLRLLLALADRQLCRPAPPPPLGQFGTRPCPSTLWDHGWPVFSTEYTVPEEWGHYTLFPARVLSADARLCTDGAPPPHLFDLPPGQRVGLLSAPELSELGGPLGALVQTSSTTTPGERLRLPPLPADPSRVPFAPETLPRVVSADRRRPGAVFRQPTSAAARRSPSPPLPPLPPDAGWEEAALLPDRGRLSWESRGRRQFDRGAPHLSNAGAAVVMRLRAVALSCQLGEVEPPARPCPLPLSRLLADVKLLLAGLPTVCFPYDPARDQFRPAAGVCTAHHTPEALAARCSEWTACGTWCRRVAALVEARGDGGLVRRAFGAAVEPCVRAYRCALLELPVNSLGHFGCLVRPQLRLMALLASVCRVETLGGELPTKMALVSDLYERLVGGSEPTEWALYAHLFRITVSPYLRFLSEWLLEGVCRDFYDEFPVREVAEACRRQDEDFWTDAYQRAATGTDSDHPAFLQALSAGMYQCGRALSLLRLCAPNHPLCRPSDLRVRLAFSLTELEEIRHRVLSYESEMQIHVSGTLARHLSEQERRQTELQAAVTAWQHATVSCVQDAMLAQRRRQADAKHALLLEQRRFMELGLAERRQRRRLERLDEELAERQRGEDETNALRRDNDERLRRMMKFSSADEIAEMRQKMKTSNNQPSAHHQPTPSPGDVEMTSPAGGQISRDEAVTSHSADAATASPADEPMLTSSDASPETEELPAASSEAEAPTAPLETDQGTPTASPETDRSTVAHRDVGVGRESATVSDSSPSADGHAADSVGDVVDNVRGAIVTAAGDNTTDAVGTVLRDATEHITDSAGNVVGDTAGGSVTDVVRHIISETTGDGDRDAANANTNTEVVPSRDDNTAARPPPPAPVADVVGDGGTSQSELAATRWQIRRRALAEDTDTPPPAGKPVLVDQIGGEVLRWRGRNVHGHSTDSRIQRIIYYGREEAELAPASTGRHWFTPRSAASPPTFQPPDFSGSLLQSCGEADTELGSGVDADGRPPDTSLDPSLDPGRGDTEQAFSADRFTLTGTLQQSITVLLKAQLSLVNAALLNHLLVEIGLMEHLVTLRRFLLLADGQFSARLSSQLTELVNVARTPHRLLNPATLNSVLNEALGVSSDDEHPHTERLSFVISYVPEVLDRASPTVLTCIDLDYRTDWPLCLVLTRRCMASYRAIFHLFLQLRRTVWSLEDVFRQLKAAGDAVAPRGGGGAQLRRLQLCRHEMQHFVLTLQQYLTGQVLQVSWAELQRDLQHAVHTFDELVAAHTAYVSRAADRCLLNAKAEPIMKVVSDIFRIVLKFQVQLSSAPWTLRDDGQAAHPNFATLMRTYRQFSDHSRFVFKVVNKTKDRLCQPHLNDLVTRLDFNGFYTTVLQPSA